jgi:hypothetical protein
VNAVVAEQQEVWPEPRTEDEFRAWGEFTAHYQSDPLGFVCTVFPWGVPGSPLENEEGPDVWQAVILDELGKQIRAGMQVIRIAVASGHGAGKSTLMAWITIWFQTCVARHRGHDAAVEIGHMARGGEVARARRQPLAVRVDADEVHLQLEAQYVVRRGDGVERAQLAGIRRCA